MSSGPQDARRAEQAVLRIERAAEGLAEALLDTGEAIMRINPQAIDIANDVLREQTGHVLVKASR